LFPSIFLEILRIYHIFNKIYILLTDYEQKNL
jgi:hypothetical protein